MEQAADIRIARLAPASSELGLLQRGRGEGFDLLTAIYEEAEYSFARRRAAGALVSVDQLGFSRRFARAALWDCEPHMQKLALEAVPPNIDATAMTQVQKLERLG